MKTITLKISDEIVKELESDIAVKHITGNLFGSIDAVMVKILKTIDNGDTELYLFRKGKK